MGFLSAPLPPFSPFFILPPPLPLLYTTHPHPQIVAPLFGLPLWIEERADKSLHGDSAICKSCCGRRVFSFPLSLLSRPPACTQPLPFLSHSCITSLRLLHSVPHNLKKPDVISSASLFLRSFTFLPPSPRSSALIS